MVYEKSTFARMRKNFHDPNLFRPQSKKKKISPIFENRVTHILLYQNEIKK